MLSDLVLSSGPPLVITQMTSKTFTASIVRKTQAIVSGGRMTGRVTERKRAKGPAPSISAASRRSRGTLCRPARVMRATREKVFQISASPIISSAVVGNRSSASGAGVTGIPLSVKDSVFADNRNTVALLNCASLTNVESLGGNVEDAASCANGGGDRPNVNPLLGGLGLHGGTTPLYELLPGSPAIDFAATCPPLDQRGLARPQGTACDSGPYETVPAALSAGDKTFFMRVGRKLRLAKNAIWVRLTCPASEVSPPCRGRAVVLDPPLVFNGVHTMQARPLFGGFKIQPGKTKAVPLRKPFGRTSRLPEGPGRWRVALRVSAQDGAANHWEFRKRRALLIRR